MAGFDTVTIWLMAFIPMATVEMPVPDASQPSLKRCFSGDGRGFNPDYGESRYRARSDVTITGFSSGQPTMSEGHGCGASHQLDCDTGDVLETAVADTSRMSFHDFRVGNTIPDPEGGVIDNPNAMTATLLYDCATANPLVLIPPAPDIDMNCFFTIDPIGRTISFSGAVDGFPDFEAYASADGGPVVTLFQHAHSVSPEFGLPGGANEPVSGTVSL